MRLRVGAACCLLLSVMVLLLPAIVASQAPPPPPPLPSPPGTEPPGTEPPPSLPPETEPDPETTLILNSVGTFNGEAAPEQAGPQTSFAPGEAIRYAVRIKNTGSSTVTASLDYLVTGPKEIYSLIDDIDIPPDPPEGGWNLYVTTTVPTDAPSGTYTLRVIMTINGQSSTKESSFTVSDGPAPQPTPLTINVPATAVWVDTGLDVATGDTLEVNAVGTWTDGTTTSEPDGSAEPWPDNFFNLADLGVCSSCARTLTENWGALIGYIGNSPPPAGSYTSTAVRSEAEKIFYIGANFQETASNDGRLWLNKNADAYSGNTVDNTGSVTATVTVTTEPTSSGQPPAAPSNVQAVEIMYESRLSTQVSWTDNADNEVGFVIVDQNRPQEYEADAVPGVGSTGSIILPFTSCFRVYAYNDYDNSPTSDMVCSSVGREPEGKAPNLVVLVHGCCTDENGVEEWDELGRLIAGKILENKTPGKWEIVVKDWSEYTPPPPDWQSNVAILQYAEIAYNAAENEGNFLANDIKGLTNHTYKYIHFITHSAGAKLVQSAASQIATHYDQNNTEKPFIHLTFLDAYTKDDEDSGKDMNNKGYGSLEGYTNHYSEHYVDRGLASTDACLTNAFNFDMSRWKHSPTESLKFGHHWPIHWYQQSVISTSPQFKYGFPLSLEGGNNLNNLISRRDTEFLPGKQCVLDTGLFNESPNPDCKPAACWE